MSRGIARCAGCGRMVTTCDHRYVNHTAVEGDTHNTCPLSRQHEPITGHTNTDYVSRAHLVTDLACQLRDEDPDLVWQYLTALPADELQRMMVVALAAIPVDRSVGDLYGWVCALPIAKVSA